MRTLFMLAQELSIATDMRTKRDLSISGAAAYCAINDFTLELDGDKMIGSVYDQNGKYVHELALTFEEKPSSTHELIRSSRLVGLYRNRLKRNRDT